MTDHLTGRRYIKHVTAVQLTSATIDKVIAWATGRGAEVAWSGIDASGYIAISVRAPGHDGELHVAADDYIVIDDAGVWSTYPADMFPHAHTDTTPA